MVRPVDHDFHDDEPSYSGAGHNDYPPEYDQDDEDVPFVAFGRAELAKRPRVVAGERIVCARCPGEHMLKSSDQVMEDGSRVPSDLLLFFTCGDKSYLAAIEGALLPGHRKAP
jgi:hypothetical protein